MKRDFGLVLLLLMCGFLGLATNFTPTPQQTPTDTSRWVLAAPAASQGSYADCMKKVDLDLAAAQKQYEQTDFGFAQKALALFGLSSPELNREHFKEIADKQYDISKAECRTNYS